MTEAHDLWDDPQAAQKIMQELTNLRESVAQYTTMKTRYDDVVALWELGTEENDDSVIPELEGQLKELEHDAEQLQLSLMLSGEYDANNAILTLHAGAGGTEARTGRRCCFVCMCGGRSAAATRWKPWICWTVTKQA